MYTVHRWSRLAVRPVHPILASFSLTPVDNGRDNLLLSLLAPGTPALARQSQHRPCLFLILAQHSGRPASTWFQRSSSEILRARSPAAYRIRSLIRLARPECSADRPASTSLHHTERPWCAVLSSAGPQLPHVRRACDAGDPSWPISVHLHSVRILRQIVHERPWPKHQIHPVLSRQNIHACLVYRGLLGLGRACIIYLTS